MKFQQGLLAAQPPAERRSAHQHSAEGSGCEDQADQIQVVGELLPGILMEDYELAQCTEVVLAVQLALKIAVLFDAANDFFRHDHGTENLNLKED